jgi:predicted kinase
MPERADQSGEDLQSPTLVVISGVPATGKSTLARLLRDELGWPLLAKDHLKETLHDAAGSMPTFTRELSKTYGRQSIALLYTIAHELLATGVSCIVEAYFLPTLAAKDLAPLAMISRVRQVHCAVPAEVSIARYQRRFEAGLRHPVHLDREAAQERAMDPIPGSDLVPIPIDVPLLSVDTRDGYFPSLAAILEFCRS